AALLCRLACALKTEFIAVWILHENLFHTIERNLRQREIQTPSRELCVHSSSVVAKKEEAYATTATFCGFIFFGGLLYHHCGAVTFESTPGELSIRFPFARDFEAKAISIEGCRARDILYEQ